MNSSSTFSTTQTKTILSNFILPLQIFEVYSKKVATEILLELIFEPAVSLQEFLFFLNLKVTYCFLGFFQMQ